MSQVVRREELPLVLTMKNIQDITGLSKPKVIPEKVLHWFLPCVCLSGPPPSRGRQGGGQCRQRLGGCKVAAYSIPPSNLPPLGGGNGHEGYSF